MGTPIIGYSEDATTGIVTVYSLEDPSESIAIRTASISAPSNVLYEWLFSLMTKNHTEYEATGNGRVDGVMIW